MRISFVSISELNLIENRTNLAISLMQTSILAQRAVHLVLWTRISFHHLFLWTFKAQLSSRMFISWI